MANDMNGHRDFTGASPAPPVRQDYHIGQINTSGQFSEYHVSLRELLQVDQSPATLYLFVLTKSEASKDVLATSQIHVIPKATHQHRAEIAKLLVHPSPRRRGIATAMMKLVEKFACDDLQRDMLNLDTATEAAALDFYRRTGWTGWGTCPDYAEFADGRRGSTTFFVKFLKERGRRPVE
ncbi:hypothetical protein SUNI508_07150 [Seiridium unicorne]|uniref:N-acetyltransferase domain-containing protein n=1 Tax=Seiridium unicorne TaxID=138068 RepID=A0ABR2UYN0_9PEZI